MTTTELIISAVCAVLILGAGAWLECVPVRSERHTSGD
jgi:hypothetical protein